MTKIWVNIMENDNDDNSVKRSEIIGKIKRNNIKFENLKLLVEYKCDVNAEDMNLWKPLIYICRNEHIKIEEEKKENISDKLMVVKYLIENKANVNGCDDELFSSLLRILENGIVDLSVVNFLLDNGADVNLCANGYWHALHCVCSNEQFVYFFFFFPLLFYA